MTQSRSPHPVLIALCFLGLFGLAILLGIVLAPVLPAPVVALIALAVTLGGAAVLGVLAAGR